MLLSGMDSSQLYPLIAIKCHGRTSFFLSFFISFASASLSPPPLCFPALSSHDTPPSERCPDSGPRRQGCTGVSWQILGEAEQARPASGPSTGRSPRCVGEKPIWQLPPHSKGGLLSPTPASDMSGSLLQAHCFKYP